MKSLVPTSSNQRSYSFVNSICLQGGTSTVVAVENTMLCCHWVGGITSTWIFLQLVTLQEAGVVEWVFWGLRCFGGTQCHRSGCLLGRTCYGMIASNIESPKQPPSFGKGSTVAFRTHLVSEG